MNTNLLDTTKFVNEKVFELFYCAFFCIEIISGNFFFIYFKLLFFTRKELSLKAKEIKEKSYK